MVAVAGDAGFHAFLVSPNTSAFVENADAGTDCSSLLLRYSTSILTLDIFIKTTLNLILQFRICEVDLYMVQSWSGKRHFPNLWAQPEVKAV